MPAKDTHEASYHTVKLRHEALLAQLPVAGSGRRGLTARELIEDLGRDHYPDGAGSPKEIRKVQRDLERLIEAERIIPATPPTTPPTYLRVLTEDEEAFDPYEWASLVESFAALLAGIVPEKRLEAALHHLQDRERGGIRLPGDRFRVLPDALRLPPADFKPGVLASILEALVQDRAVKAVYRDREGKLTRPVLHIQAALQRGPRFYVYALKNDEDAPLRMYALHRFTSVEVLDQPFRPLPDFDLDRVIATGQADFNQGQVQPLVLRARGYVADLLRDCPLQRRQVVTDEPEGSAFAVRISATVPITGQLFRWLLGCGDNIQVIEPDSMARALATQGAKVAALYPDSDGGPG